MYIHVYPTYDWELQTFEKAVPWQSFKHVLVGGAVYLPLRKIWKSVGIIIPNIRKICSKPTTRCWLICVIAVDAHGKTLKNTISTDMSCDQHSSTGRIPLLTWFWKDGNGSSWDGKCGTFQGSAGYEHNLNLRIWILQQKSWEVGLGYVPDLNFM